MHASPSLPAHQAGGRGRRVVCVGCRGAKQPHPLCTIGTAPRINWRCTAPAPRCRLHTPCYVRQAAANASRRSALMPGRADAKHGPPLPPFAYMNAAAAGKGRRSRQPVSIGVCYWPSSEAAAAHARAHIHTPNPCALCAAWNARQIVAGAAPKERRRKNLAHRATRTVGLHCRAPTRRRPWPGQVRGRRRAKRGTWRPAHTRQIACRLHWQCGSSGGAQSSSAAGGARCSNSD